MDAADLKERDDRNCSFLPNGLPLVSYYIDSREDIVPPIGNDFLLL